jgi:hypothetical protein
MADLQSQSPEATYATKGNIVAQKAYAGPRTAAAMAGADGTAIAGAPTAESVVEQHAPSANIVNGSYTIILEV